MFGRKPAAPAHTIAAGEIPVAGAPILQGASEFLRMWSSADGPVVCFVQPRALGADPFMLGIALADAVNHGAKAYAAATGISEADAKARILEGLDAERANPTDIATPLPGTTH